MNLINSNYANISNLSQLNVNLGGMNLPIMPLISARDYFLLLQETWAGTVPTNNQFMVIFESFPVAIKEDWFGVELLKTAANTVDNISNAIGITDTDLLKNQIQNMEPVGSDTDAWADGVGKSTILSYPFQNVVGCIFAQEFDVPVLDQLRTTNLTVNNYGGLIPGVITENRTGYANNNLTIGFLETNTSFVDLVIRPWSILTSHYGLTARDPNDKEAQRENMRTNIIILEYTTTQRDISQVPRKIWTFYDCVPISVDGRQNTMKQSTDVKSYKTTWLFRKYNIKNNTYIPVSTIMDNISSGSWTNIFKI